MILLISCEQQKQTPATQTADNGYSFERGYPTADTAKQATDDSDFSRAVQAYRFWYPTVSTEGIMNGNRSVGILDNQSFGIAAAGPRQVGFTLNADTPYGAAALDLSKGPMVIELPPGTYIGLVDDHNQSWITDMGIPGPDAGKGGKHLILPPDYKGSPPAGYYVGHSPTYKVISALRVIPVNGDVPGAMNALRAVKIYPLSTGGHSQLMTAVDTTDKDMDSSCLKWEDNIQFWQKLKSIIDAEPTVDAFRPMYGLLSAIGIEKGKSFSPDDRMKGILERAAKVGNQQMLVTGFASTRPDRMAWPDRKWEWAGLVPGDASFETPNGMDLDARDRWFIQAIVASPAMFRRTAGAGSLYWLGLRDTTGTYLDGGKTYKLTVPQPVPGKLFWSVTVYDSETRSMVKTDQNKAALRSMYELKNVSTTQPTELYFGPAAPAGKENLWIKTNPGKGWFTYFRIYGPEQPAFDGSWKPGDFEEVK
jgi:hypothetical protein